MNQLRSCDSHVVLSFRSEAEESAVIFGYKFEGNRLEDHLKECGASMMQFSLEGLATPVILHPATPLTDDELIFFSERNKPYKIERNREGGLTIQPPLGGIDAFNELHVAASLYTWAKQEGCGQVVGPNTGFNLRDGSCLAPDAAWTSYEQLHLLTPDQQAGFLPLCPDFIVEVRSRGDARHFLEAKMQLWMDNGAKLAWLVDPIENEVTIYQLNAKPKKLDRPELIVATSPVAGFQLTCNRLWSPR